jgi:hypothetical protein
MNQRRTEVIIPEDDFRDEETARASFRAKVQPWLDELKKDEVPYQNLTFYIEQSQRAIMTDGVLVVVTVDVPDEE